MSTADLHGELADGRRFRASSYALDIASADGELLEQIDLQDVSDVGRDGTALSLHMRDDQTRVFVAASLDDAGRLYDHLRRTTRPPTPVRRPPRAAPPPVTRQTVHVERASGPSAMSIILGLIVVVILVLLAILAVNAIRESDSDDPTAMPTEEPAPAPTTEPEPTSEPEPTPEPEATPQAGLPGHPNADVAVEEPSLTDWVKGKGIAAQGLVPTL